MEILNNALITGGHGMVGKNINFGIKPTSSEMDITDSNSIVNYISKLNNITCIIHLAACNLRDSEDSHTESINLNINGTINMLKLAMQLNIPFIFLSSGAVFSSFNQNMIFDENYKTCPNSMYGYTKESSEKISLLYDKTILIRTGWLFGGNQKTHYKFVENTINYLLTNNSVIASNNLYGSPTYVIDLIDQMKDLIINLKYGIHHIVNSGFATGYDIAIEICRLLNKEFTLIKSVESHQIPNAGPLRSLSESLSSSHCLRSWKLALKDYIQLYLININVNKPDLTINKIWSERKQCRLCDSYNLETFLNLEPTPPANQFIKTIHNQDKIPLDLCKCKDCNHIQLLQIIDPEYLYRDYFYVSSTSATMTNHLIFNLDEFISDLNKEDNILEIGANDGICIQHLLNNGFQNVLGIDPAININKRHKLPIICDFFGSNSLDKIQKKYKSFKLIYAFHCCAHIENIQDVFSSIYKLLDDDGIFIMEVGYFYKVYKNNIFDVVYHEHIDYHTCTAMQKFAFKNNLLLYKVKENNIQGGSIQFYICKNSFRSVDNSVLVNIQKEKDINLFSINNLLKMKNNITKCCTDIRYIINGIIASGKIIVGYGASAKSTTFLHQFNLSNSTIKYIIDDNIYKQNFYSPGLHIPIRSINILETEIINYVIILSCNFTEEILSKLEKYRVLGLRIIIPYPEIKII
jgi:dTDP-4-dehydrorhamnose reductase/2-polyprenyl-3-methyl-5-hydroxy-6-metoxy-1,4-benzoquinol methylase